MMSDLPASPLVYWEAELLHRLYSSYPPIGDLAPIREGIHTGDNARFLRYWWEVSAFRLKLDVQRREEIDASGARWIPYNKGGTATRWYGNNLLVIAFDRAARADMSKLSGFVEPSKDLYFLEGGTWSDVGTSGLRVKYYPSGYLFDAKGPVVVGGDQNRFLIGAMNSSTFGYVGELLMPTISYKAGTVKKIPLPSASDRGRVADLVSEAIGIARRDWDADEVSRDFGSFPALEIAAEDQRLSEAFDEWARQTDGSGKRLRDIEEVNNRLFEEWYELGIDGRDRHLAFELSNVSAPTTKACAEQLASYAVGCMFGRYSLDESGLILADQGATLQDYLAKVPTPTIHPRCGQRHPDRRG